MSGCIVWPGLRTRDGYSVIHAKGRGGGMIYLHRVAYEAAFGPIPAGYQVDHLCRNRACLHPGHLEAVTPQENNRRSDSLSARRMRQSECVQGHPLSGSNLYRWGTRRYCRTCRATYKGGKRLSLEVKEAK